MWGAIYGRGVLAVVWAGAMSVAAAQADEAPFRWTGTYVGAHTGAALDYSDFSNPYGATLFGDEVRSPGPFLGGQFGYNYQDGLFVYGLQADVTWANLQGTATCMQPVQTLPGEPGLIGGAYGGTCEVEPDWFGTFTARGGFALGPEGRILVYGKGGLAWMHNNVELSQNNAAAPDFGPTNSVTKSSFTQLGWTLGAGLEYALDSRWSLGVEYDYLHFGDKDVATANGAPINDPGFAGVAGSLSLDGRAANFSQDIHAAKLVLNYALADRSGPLGSTGPGNPIVAAARAGGLEMEIGGRYVYSWTRFQQDLGKGTLPLPINNSRLTWENVGTNGAEVFARVDTPWNIMAKTIVGVGRGQQGHIYDEDWGMPEPENAPTFVRPYQLTQSNVSSSLDYFTLDGGYDVLRTQSFRVAPFIGYNYFRYKMNALGSSYLNFSPPQPGGEAPTTVFLQEMDEWRSMRLGTVADINLTPALKLTADVAYLPYVRFNGVDNHPLRVGEGPSSRSPAHGIGTGVQIEGLVAYDITERFSLGIGGRYWSMQIPQGLTNFFSSNEFTKERFSTENAALFAQGAYQFAAP